ncbi:MAG: sensory histidine kinase CreC [Methanocella sp. PtaU1.Bin125]|nr:MAG: sensory histidine kinase CreC [Methanocella sp. PtaU1.Bin125]
MDSFTADPACIIDRDGLIVWASPSFVELFSHRASPVGMIFNQLFPGLTGACRHGVQVEDRDRVGRKRYFRVECRRMSGPGGDRVSDVAVLRNVTLARTLSDIARLSTQTKTPKELLEKALWLIKDTYGYLGLAGFQSRGAELELIASKGWTEKLKSMIRTVPIAPDAPAMAGRCAYHREQMVTTISEYGLMPTVKDAIERIGGEFVVVTPLIDHDRLTGVLTVIHSRALSPEELDTLQTVCGALAVSLNVRMQEDELSARAEDATLFVDLLSHEIALHEAIVRTWAGKPGDDAARDNALRALQMDDEAIADIRGISDSGVEARTVPLTDAIALAVGDTELIARHAGKKITISRRLTEKEARVGPLMRYALRNVLVNSLKYVPARTVEVDVRTTVDRAGACKIEITDSGPGIPDELKSGVFRREDRPGQGTGLYLVKRIVSRYGGRVWIEDRVPGNRSRGTRVVIILPPAAA